MRRLYLVNLPVGTKDTLPDASVMEYAAVVNPGKEDESITISHASHSLYW